MTAGTPARAGWPAAPAVPWQAIEERARPLRPLLLPWLAAVVVATLALGGNQDTWAPWLTGLAFGSFLLALNRPAWLLVPILVGELTLYNYTSPAFGVAQRMVVIVVALALALPALVASSGLSDLRLRRVLVPAVLFVMLATAINSLHSTDEYVLPYLRYQLVQVFALVVAASVIRTRRDLSRVAIAVLAIGTLTGLAMVWQHYAPLSAPYGARGAEAARNWQGREIGFAGSPVASANQMLFLIGPLLGVLLVGPWRRDRTRLLLGGCLLILLLALNFTYTRSAVFGLAPAVVVMGLYLSRTRRLLVIGAVLMAAIAFQGLENTGLVGSRYYEDAEEDRSAASHEALWDVGLAVALDNSLTGIGHEHFEEVSLSYIDAVAAEGDALAGDSAIGQQRPHNDFLAVWSSWGIAALALYVLLFIGTIRNLRIAMRTGDPLVRGLALGCLGGLIAYGVNSAFHNSMDSSVFLWLYAGSSVALARIAQHPAPLLDRLEALVLARRASAQALARRN